MIRIELVHPPTSDLRVWRRAARRSRDRGHAAILCPEAPGGVDPVAALAAAAGAGAPRVGTHVIVAARHGADEIVEGILTVAAEAPGRLDVGIGTGLVRAGGSAGTPGPSGAELRARVESVVRQVRAADPRIRLTVAGSGPRAIALAVRVADELAISLPPDAPVTRILAASSEVSRAAGRVGLAVGLVAVGDVVSTRPAHRLDAASLRRTGAFARLPADPHRAVRVLHAWHHLLGVTRVVIDPSLEDAIQPALDLIGSHDAPPDRAAVGPAPAGGRVWRVGAPPEAGLSAAL